MKITKTRKVKTPERGTALSAGLDFFVPEDFTSVFLSPSEDALVPSGIKVAVPEGHALIAFNKSGLAIRGFQVGACVVDEDYQGEVHLHVRNVSESPRAVSPGDKLVQFILVPVNYSSIEVVEETELYRSEAVSERGEGAFGSTGTR